VARLRDIDKSELFGGKKGEASKQAHDKLSAMSQQELAEEVEQLEKDINELRGQYELYFMGVERIEPLVARDGIRAKLRRFKEVTVTNTATKFKMQMLQARMVSLETYWGRVNRQREAGTYHRDIEKVRRREAELRDQEARKAKLKGDVAPTATGAPALPEGTPLSGNDLRSGAQEAKTASRQPGAEARPSSGVSRPAASRPEDLSEPQLKQLYQTYVTAKRRCGEQVDLRYEEMAASLRKQVPKLLQSTGAKAIEFKVVIKGGHAVLKAVPKT
jgi:hypothetical protein